MSKKRKRGQNLANQLDSDFPTPDQVDAMFSDVDDEKKSKKEEKNISRKEERKKFGTQLKPDLIKRLKGTALKRDMTITELLEKILEEYLDGE